MRDNKSPLRISNIIDFKPVSGKGKGMLGFVITYPNGRVQNEMMDYTAEDFDSAMKQISAKHRKALSRCHKKSI